MSRFSKLNNKLAVYEQKTVSFSGGAALVANLYDINKLSGIVQIIDNNDYIICRTWIEPGGRLQIFVRDINGSVIPDGTPQQIGTHYFG